MSSRIFIDQMGREVTLTFPPRRIISLVPSQTEFLVNLEAPVIGRTKFCVHPAISVKNIPVIGGTKNFRFEEIKRLNPDLIIGNKEENYEEGMTKLERSFPVWMSDIFSLEDAFKMMLELGRICDKAIKTEQVVDECKRATDSIKDSKNGRVIYLIWKNPWMAAGTDTFIDHMLNHLGYKNLVSDSRYPELTNGEIRSLNPEKILLSSEPYPFKEKHLKEIQIEFPNAKIELVDGELHSWYGSRLRHWSKN